MFLETSQKHTPLNVQTTPPGMNSIFFLKPKPTPPEIPCAVSLPADQHVPETEENDFSLGPRTSEPVDLPSDHTEEMQPLLSTSVDQLRCSARQRRRPARYDDYGTDF